MKPKEFDELIRQKFDQNDFEYDPRSWDRLEEQLDGRSKRRSIMLWWLMPVAGIAASVALAIGVAPLLKYQGGVKPGAGSGLAKVQKTEVVRPAQAAPQADIAAGHTYAYTTEARNEAHHVANKMNHKRTANKQMKEDDGDDVTINLQNALPSYTKASRKSVKVNLLDESKAVVKKENKEQKKAKEPVQTAMATFKPEEQKIEPKTSIILSGGYNKGSQNTGYSAAVTVRKVISDKVFFESDLGYASSNISQGMPYYIPTTVYGSGGHGAGAAKVAGSDKTNDAKTTGGTDPKPYIVNGPRYVDNVNFSLSYAEIHPAVGVKIMKRISIGAGPDFQQALGDNRPAASATNTDVNQKYPLFDVGLMGKTECIITKNIRAGVSYRKGVNSMIAPAANYLDRDYLQFQLNYAVFNK